MLLQPFRRNLRSQATFHPAQIQRRHGSRAGCGDLALLHGIGQAVASLFFEYPHQAGMQMAVAVVAAQCLGLTQCLGGIEPLNQVPGGQVIEHAAGHFAAAGAVVAQAQQRLHFGNVELVVKVRTANVHARGGEDVLRTVPFACVLRAQAHHGEVRRTAANVHHQNAGLFAQALLIVQRCRNGLQLESHFLETCRVRGSFQRSLCLRITLGVSIHKVHGAAQHHTLRHAAHVLLRLLSHVLEEDGNDVLVTHQLAVHCRLVLQQAAAQQAFERAHQAAFFARQVLPHRITAVVRAVVFVVKEQRRGHGRCLAFQRHQLCALPGGAPCHGGVGSTKVNTQRGVRKNVHARNPERAALYQNKSCQR